MFLKISQNPQENTFGFFLGTFGISWEHLSSAVSGSRASFYGLEVYLEPLQGSVMELLAKIKNK